MTENKQKTTNTKYRLWSLQEKFDRLRPLKNQGSQEYHVWNNLTEVAIIKLKLIMKYSDYNFKRKEVLHINKVIKNNLYMLKMVWKAAPEKITLHTFIFTMQAVLDFICNVYFIKKNISQLFLFHIVWQQLVWLMLFM